jgi:uncharacterized protein (DUF1499 family)
MKIFSMLKLAKSPLTIVFLSCLIAIPLWLTNISPAAAQTSSNKIMASLLSFPGNRPQNLGVTDNKLAPCPQSPNCVSSQSTDSEHQIAPLSYNSPPEAAIAKLQGIIQNLERTKIITVTANYLYAEFTSALMGFVDDVEFYLDETSQVIHVRSASRLGQSDLGVNRQRIETIRNKFQ